jgi:hypothetical protein
MKIEGDYLIVLMAVAVAGIDTKAPSSDYYKFPELFMMGTATASYQIEGGWEKDGKTEYLVANVHV